MEVQAVIVEESSCSFEEGEVLRLPNVCDVHVGREAQHSCEKSLNVAVRLPWTLKHVIDEVDQIVCRVLGEKCRHVRKGRYDNRCDCFLNEIGGTHSRGNRSDG